MSFSFEAIGTKWIIDLPELSQEEQNVIQRKIRERIADFDHTYSRFKKDSLVTTMSQQAGTYTLPSDADALMRFYKQLYDVTNSAVTPLIGQTLVDAGYDASYSLKPQAAISTPKSWESVISWDNPHITLKEPALLDIGAAGKGYLVDIISELIEQDGITSYCVDAGGDMRHRGNKPLTVGLENPFDTKQIIGVAAIQNQSLCGSAGNRRVWDRFHHTINPHTLSSPTHIVATWVIAPNTMIADGFATALLFVSPEKLLSISPFAYCYVKENGEAVRSPNFSAQLFTN